MLLLLLMILMAQWTQLIAAALNHAHGAARARLQELVYVASKAGDVLSEPILTKVGAYYNHVFKRNRTRFVILVSVLRRQGSLYSVHQVVYAHVGLISTLDQAMANDQVVAPLLEELDNG